MLLVNCAGASVAGSFEDLSLDDFKVRCWCVSLAISDRHFAVELLSFHPYHITGHIDGLTHLWFGE